MISSLATVSLCCYQRQGNGYENLMTLLRTKPEITSVKYRTNFVETEGDQRLFNFLASNPAL